MSGLFEELSGAKGLRAQGKSEQNIQEFNAKVEEQKAAALRARANFDQIRDAEEAERIKGATAASLGAAGATGSPVAIDIAAKQGSELELENLLIGFEGEVKAGQAETQATLDRLQGKLAFQGGKAAARRANVSFGTQLVGLGAGAAG